MFLFPLYDPASASPDPRHVKWNEKWWLFLHISKNIILFRLYLHQPLKDDLPTQQLFPLHQKVVAPRLNPAQLLGGVRLTERRSEFQKRPSAPGIGENSRLWHGEKPFHGLRVMWDGICSSSQELGLLMRLWCALPDPVTRLGGVGKCAAGFSSGHAPLFFGQWIWRIATFKKNCAYWNKTYCTRQIMLREERRREFSNQ